MSKHTTVCLDTNTHDTSTHAVVHTLLCILLACAYVVTTARTTVYSIYRETILPRADTSTDEEHGEPTRNTTRNKIAQRGILSKPNEEHEEHPQKGEEFSKLSFLGCSSCSSLGLKRIPLCAILFLVVFLVGSPCSSSHAARGATEQ